MFEKEKAKELYKRTSFTTAEELFKHYKAMRQTMSYVENLKYSNEDPYISSEEFKQGFIA